MDKSIAAGEVNLKSVSNKLRSSAARYQAAGNSAPQPPSSPAEEAGRFLGGVASSGAEALISIRHVRLLVGNVSTATLYRMLASGDFPKPISVTAGRKAWPLSAVQAWIKRRTDAAAEGAHR
jgi:predicted DNA-binding transcriptional regulator AlpA